MTLFTSAINLDDLPDIDYVEQIPHDQITAETIAWLLENEGIELTGPEDPSYRIVRACNYRELLLRDEYNTACKNLTLKNAVDGYLDHIGVTYHRTPRLIDEADAAYRNRIALAPEATSVAGPDGAYVWHVLRVDPVIRDAKAHEVVEGRVAIYVLTNDGNLPAELKARIEAVFNDQSVTQPQEVRPLAINVEIQPVEMVDYLINATLTIATGVDAEQAKANALAATQLYVDQQMQIGGRVVESFIDHFMHVDGVLNVDVAAWADIETTLTQAPRATAINITTQVAA